MSESTNVLDDLKRIEEEKNNPGSWVERIMRSMTSKKKEQAVVHPCIINGKHTLVHEHGLAEKDPDSYEQIVKFANAQGYTLKEDQRTDFLEGIKRVKNRRRANVVSVMALTAGLMMSQSASANTDDDHDHGVHVSSDVEHSQVEAGFDLDLDSFDTDGELAAGLLGWINNHSSFDFDLENIPNIEKVTSTQIAEVAFGGELPEAVDPDSLQIFGLYNFNDGSVYLLDSIDLDSDEGKGILLHELVHYLQYQTGVDKDAKCMNELESLAYVLEAKFHESNNHEHNITDAHIDKVSQCST